MRNFAFCAKKHVRFFAFIAKWIIVRALAARLHVANQPVDHAVDGGVAIGGTHQLRKLVAVCHVAQLDECAWCLRMNVEVLLTDAAVVNRPMFGLEN